jgi:hypothetical protein
MLRPNHSDWGYQEIERAYPDRAAKLAKAGSADALIEGLNDALKKALTADVRVGFDGIGNDLSAPRVWIQFPVPAELYDWFFSARTGYRAQYWISPHVGHAFNAQLIQRLRMTIEGWAPCSGVEGRAIWVQTDNGYPEFIDKGPRTEGRDSILTSLTPEVSKVWICERQIQRHGGALVDMRPIGMRSSELCVPRWGRAGRWAPLPDDGDAWLDIKGGYVQPDGRVVQPNKSPEKRANDLHKTGDT